jgi:hypothetical protein
MTFRGITENRLTRQFEVFSTLDSHVKVTVEQYRSAVEPIETLETQYPTGCARRAWSIAARQHVPELRRADL